MKKVSSFIATILLSLTFLSGSAFAKDITTLDVVGSNGQMTVTGTTEEGVLAIAVLVYSGEDLAYMETCPATNETYSCMLGKTFEDGDYVVKVADYDGGDYKSKNITLSSVESPEGEPEEEAPKSPDTGREGVGQVGAVVASVLSFCLVAGLLGAVVLSKKLLHKK